jgi:hypothetical protein
MLVTTRDRNLCGPDPFFIVRTLEADGHRQVIREANDRCDAYDRMSPGNGGSCSHRIPGEVHSWKGCASGRAKKRGGIEVIPC